jgi:ATP-dependent RNA helicase SUPV3L1/SUV3
MSQEEDVPKSGEGRIECSQINSDLMLMREREHRHAEIQVARRQAALDWGERHACTLRACQLSFFLLQGRTCHLLAISVVANKCQREVMLVLTRRSGRPLFPASISTATSISTSSALRLRHPILCRAFSSTRHALRDSSSTHHSSKNFSFNRKDTSGPNGKRPLIRRQAADTKKQKFPDVLREHLGTLKLELELTPIGQKLEAEGKFRETWSAFADSVISPGDRNSTHPNVVARRAQHQALRDSWFERGLHGLHDRIKYAFYNHVTSARFTSSDIRNQKALADLRYPTEWYPATRTMHRTIHLHVGPTNSGKTYHALQRLEQAETGVYAGPLRLLAHEVFTRLNAKGKQCMLITGEEKRAPDDSLAANITSCTVEMMPLNKDVDVAVIDEIQMIGNADRGWAWTQAVLGVKAREVHLCGEIRTVPLIRELCASLGEKLIVHEYERLSPLQMADKSLRGNLKKLRKGDCIVSFSVMGIHALRKQIEQSTGRKVATVYGSLPPETRAQQARLFNDPDNDYDFLVASDAIGMGLNLSIKRVIFESSSKFDGFRQRTLATPDIKQIAGRAGRYKSAFQANKASEEAVTQALAEAKADSEPEKVTTIETSVEDPAPIEASPQGVPAADVDSSSQTPTTEEASAKSQDSTLGLVTTLEDFDFPVIAKAMKEEPDPIRSAGIFPPAPIVERFASYFPPGTPFSYILMRLHELSQMHSRFHLCGLRDQLWIADLIEPIQGLTVTDRNILCACPASKSDKDLISRLMPALARCIEQQGGGALYEIEEMPLEVLELEMSPNREYLRKLEQLHKAIVSYLWLSYRFAGIFSTRPLAFHVKGLVEEKIEHVLHQFSFTESQRRKIKAAREKSLMAESRRETMLVDEEDDHEAVTELEQQTSITAGGDRFAGETDIEIMDAAEWTASEESSNMTEDLPPRTVDSTEAQTTQNSTQAEEDKQNQEIGSTVSEMDELNLAHDQATSSSGVEDTQKREE